MPKGYKGREKTERLHMLISPKELEEIDEWQHSVRVATRSDAIRRLVQIGLSFDALADGLEKDAVAITRMIIDGHTFKDMIKSLDQSSNEVTEGNVLRDALANNARLIVDVLEAQTALATKIGAVTAPTRQLRKHASFEAAMKSAHDALSAVTQAIEGWENDK